MKKYIKDIRIEYNGEKYAFIDLAEILCVRRQDLERWWWLCEDSAALIDIVERFHKFHEQKLDISDELC